MHADNGHAKGLLGWLFMIFGLAADFLSTHGMTILSAAAIVTGIVYHVVLIRQARRKHEAEMEVLAVRKAHPWTPFFGPETRN
jgi:hypothetical protein